MRAITKPAAKILDLLTADLLPLDADGATAKRVGEKGGAFMQVVVERLDEETYSVAHYYEQNGDLMRDPEMVFLKGCDGQWYPISFRQDGTGTDQTSAEKDPARGWLVAPRLQAEHARFASMWMRNIRAQQHAFFAKVA